METTIYLIRHGATLANLENRFAGRTQEPLHDTGLAQAGEVGRLLRGRGIGRVYCGPLARTRQTAAILGQILKAEVKAAAGLNEIRLPHWDGLTKEEIRQRFGPQYPCWLETPQDFSLPGCETIAAVQDRAGRVVEAIFSEQHGKAVAVVSHLIVLRALILRYQDRPIREFRAVKVGNGEVIALRREGDETSVLVL